MGNMCQGLITTTKQNSNCPWKVSVCWHEDLVIWWLLSCFFTYLSSFPAPQWNFLYPCVSKPLPTSLAFHMSYTEIFPCGHGTCVQGSCMGSMSGDSSSEHKQPQESFMLDFSCASQGHAQAPASKEKRQKWSALSDCVESVLPNCAMKTKCSCPPREGSICYLMWFWSR